MDSRISNTTPMIANTWEMMAWVVNKLEEAVVTVVEVKEEDIMVVV
jgi:hypothetical protein